MLTGPATRSAEIFRRWLPDLFVFALLLTLGCPVPVPSDRVDGSVVLQGAVVAMAVPYGGKMTNLLQPFFLLVLMPVIGDGVRIQSRDVIGYLFVPFVVVLTLIGLPIAFVPVR